MSPDPTVVRSWNPVKNQLEGRKFGRWKVLSSADKRYHWACECECGTRRVVRQSSLISGASTSCGCLTREAAKRNFTTHGMSGTREFRIWSSMIDRCYNKNFMHFARYGGRGIAVCPRWRHDFLTFFRDMGKLPADDLTIERIDNDGPYSPENCKWATRREQSRNRSMCRILTYAGKSLTVMEWSEITGIKVGVLYHRINKYGWSAEKTLTTPVAPRTSRKTTRD